MTHGEVLSSTQDSPMVLPVKGRGWGWLATLSVIDALALLMMALAFTVGRNNIPGAEALFWGSLLIIFVPIAVRLVLPTISQRERCGLVILLGLALYLVKVLHSPTHFTFHDEFLHWRTSIDILRTSHLFSSNPILPVSALYPGLEIITSAVANLSGLSIFESGLLTIGIGRIILMLALYLFYERISRSEQVAGIATLLYVGNSNFLFFDAQFSYESLALPIATAILCVVVRRHTDAKRSFLTLAILTLPLIGALTITHHLTAYAVVGVLVLFMIGALLYRSSKINWISIGMIAAIMLAAIGLWTAYVGNTTSSYLGPVITSGTNEFLRFIVNEDSGRQLFHGAVGQVSALWERIVGIVATLFILAALPWGILRIWRAVFVRFNWLTDIKNFNSGILQSWRRYRNNPFIMALSLITLLYPVMLALRLTTNGWEIANRSSEFVFWAASLVIAIGILSVQSFRLPQWLWTAGFVIWATVIFVGGVISGWPPWARLPGAYLVSADQRSIEPQGIMAATWTGQFLNMPNRIAADRINSLLLATYGHQQPVTHLYDNIYLAPVFFAARIGSEEQQLLRSVNLHYLLVDDRLSTMLPQVGVYFEAGEPEADQHQSPIPLAALTKFSGLNNVSQLFDSGNIKIYDVSHLNVSP